MVTLSYIIQQRPKIAEVHLTNFIVIVCAFPMILNISIKELKLWKNGEIHWALESLGTCRDVFRAGDDHIGIIPAFKPWFRPAGITADCIAVSLIHGWLIFIPCWQEFQWGQKCHFHTLQNLLCWSLLKAQVFWPVLLTFASNTTMPSTNIIKHLQTKLYKNCYYQYPLPATQSNMNSISTTLPLWNHACATVPDWTENLLPRCAASSTVQNIQFRTLDASR